MPQSKMKTFKGFTIYGHGGNLDNKGAIDLLYAEISWGD